MWLVVTGGNLLLEARRKANVPDDLGSHAVCTAQTQKCKDMTLLVLGFFTGWNYSVYDSELVAETRQN